MKKLTSLLLLCALAFSFAACKADYGITGTWSCTENGQSQLLVLYEDGTGTISVDGTGMDITWSTAEDKYLTVTITVANTPYNYFDGVEYTVEKNTLTLYENGNMAVYSRI